MTIEAIFESLGTAPAAGEFTVSAPGNGAVIARLQADTAHSLDRKIDLAWKSHAAWSALKRNERAQTLEIYSSAIRAHRDALAELIHLEAGKTMKESLGEADGSADILLKTIKDASMPELSGMLRTKERPALGAVALITSFNFPLAVAHWTLGPALLAGNGVVWKPSEKTPLVAAACKAIFDRACPEWRDVFQVVIGGRDIGEALVASEQIAMVSATGSVAMGQAIKATLSRKTNSGAAPILELGGNNGVILSEKISAGHLAFAAKSLLNSFFGSTGQRCTNTRRVIVHQSRYDELAALLKTHIETFLKTIAKDGGFDAANDYGYGPLIDEDAFKRFEQAKAQVIDEGGKVIFGARLFAKEHPNAFYVEPALGLLPSQRSLKAGELSIMYQETFAPILFLAPYSTFEQAIELVNAPANAGLVNGIYTQSQKEADVFAAKNQAGHSVINSAKGTGTPAFGMGFGGNKESGSGEILNAADPLAPFTRARQIHRVAQNKDIAMDAD